MTYYVGMSTYTVTPGNIAAVCYVKTEGAEETFIYLSAEKTPVTSPHDDKRPFLSLPSAVQDAIIEHFVAVFALPVEQRGDYLKTCIPREIAA